MKSVSSHKIKIWYLCQLLKQAFWSVSVTKINFYIPVDFCDVLNLKTYYQKPISQSEIMSTQECFIDERKQEKNIPSFVFNIIFRMVVKSLNYLTLKSFLTF